MRHAWREDLRPHRKESTKGRGGARRGGRRAGVGSSGKVEGGVVEQAGEARIAKRGEDRQLKMWGNNERVRRQWASRQRWGLVLGG